MMYARSKVTLFLVCCLMLVTAGCASNAPAGGQTLATPVPSSNSGQPAATLVPTQVPPTEMQSPTPTEAPAVATSAPTTSNPLDALSKAINSFTAAKSFRVQISQTGGTPTAMSRGMTMEVVEPDRVHTLIPGVAEVIQIGSTYYYRQGANGTWTKVSLPAGVTPPALPGTAFDPKAFVTNVVKTKGVSFSGPDILNGKPMLTYTYTPDPTQDSKIVSGKLWVGATDGLPYQGQATDKDGSVVTVVYTYGSDIQINPPIP